MAADARRLLRSLAGVDPRAAVWCACLAARGVLPLVVPGELRPRRALEAAEAWLWGRADAEGCVSASDAAHRAAFDGYAVGGRAAANAAHAAGYAAGAVGDVSDAVRAVDAAATAVGNAAVRGWREASANHLAALAGELAAAGWPLTVPTAAEVVAAPAEAQVAWDWLSGRPEPEAQTVAALIEAHARAGRLGLDWADPVQRAVAERAVDEDGARGLLDRRLAPPG
jgi:hypothetical protein